MKLTKIKPKFIEKHNPRIGLITLASDFRIEKDFSNVIHGEEIDLYCNRIQCYNPLTNETLKKMADDIPEDVLKDHSAKNAIPPLYGALLKNEQDVHLLEKIAFMHRANS